MGWRRLTSDLLVAIICACALAILTNAEPVVAATFFVEDGAAVGDGEPGDGVCKSKLRPSTLLRNCTLMAAIEEANALPGFHTIMVPAGTFRFDAFRVGELHTLVTGRMRIVGKGAASTELTAGGVVSGGIAVSVGGKLELRDLTYRDSKSLFNSGAELEIVNSVIRDNEGPAGGITHDVVRNAAGTFRPTTTITNSRITNNKSFLFNGPAGGISVNDGRLVMESSTIDGNIGRTNGSVGGLVVFNNGIADLRNVTISGNQAAGGDGNGGIAVAQGLVTARNVTIANNTPNGVKGFPQQNAGDPRSLVQLRNVVLANNGSANCAGTLEELNDISSVILDSGTTCSFLNIPGTISNVNPQLGPLQINGGPTPTHALPAGSPAIDAGFCELLTDQRGIARPRDGDGNGSLLCDIGAFERAPGFLGIIPPLGVPLLNPVNSTVQPNQTLTEAFAWDLPAPTNWGGLGTLDLRLRSSSGAIVFWLHWDQVLDTFQLFDQNGQPTGFALPPGLPVPLSANGVTLDVGGVRTQGSGITGQRVTLTLPLRFDPSTAGQTFSVEVSAQDDDGRQDPFRQVGAIAVAAVVAVPAANSVPPAADLPPVADLKPNEDDAPRRLTEAERRQKSRTNRSGLDDEHVEGNVVVVRADLRAPEVDVANRDGVVTLRLVKGAARLAGELKPGDYVSGDGQKEHEYLYWVEDLDVER